MTTFDIYELTNVDLSRREREIHDLPEAVRARFAGHAASVNQIDVAAEFLQLTEQKEMAA